MHEQGGQEKGHTSEHKRASSAYPAGIRASTSPTPGRLARYFPRSPLLLLNAHLSFLHTSWKQSQAGKEERTTMETRSSMKLRPRRPMVQA